MKKKAALACGVGSWGKTKQINITQTKLHSKERRENELIV